MSAYDVVRLFVVLVVVLGVIYGVLYLMKRFLYEPRGRTAKLKMETLGMIAVAPKKYVAAVRVRDKVLVVGVSEQSITLLDKLEDVPEELLREDAKSERPNFLDYMKQSLGGK
ncbi:MAG: flagellar biosynthetic protein FliO [Ignavibacteriales bacterium]|jgi:flagellar biosynthetic protein FliO|nr:flagellar biosynthetic protein FliO [Ignavibacteriales bacterium]